MPKSLEQNEANPCSVSGCPSLRAGFSKHCHLHRRRTKTYGGPHVRHYVRIPSLPLADARTFVASNTSHAAIVQARHLWSRGRASDRGLGS